uniref:Mannose-6-phosphate receptor (cation dependent) n=1 Tax=Oreochromis niloticus TaxID=8128 RepID=I3K4Y6_ORENI
SFLVWIVAFQLVLCVSGVYSVKSTKDCTLISESPLQRKVLERLEPLVGKNFTAEDKASNESYTYVFQLCGDAGGVRNAGLIQGMCMNLNCDWVMLIYKNGEKYDSHCNKEERKAIIMISCDRNVKDGCDFVCRSRKREESPAYRGVATDNLQEEPEERDDHLLPM